jgi:uncharacterized RDD family membrane protein YckC
MNGMEYAGFWIRALAAMIDSLVTVILLAPFAITSYGIELWMGDSFFHGGWDIIITYMLPAAAVILFWTYKAATPGKMATRLIIVDAKTGGKPTTGQYIRRYLGYYVSALPFFIGLFWVGIDRQKQGWHDKIAGTVVIRNRWNTK